MTKADLSAIRGESELIMTNYEKFIKDHVRTTTIITMYGDWTNKLHIVRTVNGYSERAIIAAKYDDTTMQTVITVKGV